MELSSQLARERLSGHRASRQRKLLLRGEITLQKLLFGGIRKSLSGNLNPFIQPEGSHLRENTVASVLHALEQGVHMVEVDVQVGGKGYSIFLTRIMANFCIQSNDT